MEMRDPSSVSAGAEEQPLTPAMAPAPTSAEAAAETNPELIDGCDPEGAAENEAVDGIEEAETEDTELHEELTRDVLVSRARAILEKEAADITTDDIRHLRQQYNSLRKTTRRDAITDEAEELPVAEGEMGADEFAEDEEFKTLLQEIREKKAEYTARVEAERAANLARKQEIIVEILSLADDTDNVNRTFARYRELQDEFNAIGEVPATEDTAIWKKYQDARERYSDNLKINKELRDYDFKKNLDSKQLLLNEAQELTTAEDVITAYRRLQELHSKWRLIGPVAKEVREVIWETFKAASAEINKRYQAHFEARKAAEAENEARKTELCERLEALDYSQAASFKAWEDLTAKVMEIQNEWRSYGFASRKMNKLLFARYRALCDKFFAAKAEFYRSTRETHARNLASKTALAEQAEALKDSTDWRGTTDKLVALQKEWKTIGTVAKRQGDAVWQRFTAACDYFFDQKKKATSGARREQADNLRAKRAVIAALAEISPETPREEAIEKMRALQKQWNEIGHVPFRDKDKVYDEYRAKCDALRQNLNLRDSRERMDRFSNNVNALEGDNQKLQRERERLVRTLENRRQELRTYDNNLGFLSATSKNGDSLLRDFARRADRIRADIADLEEKIRLLDDKLS